MSEKNLLKFGLKALKISGWTLLAAVALTLGALALVPWVLSPERLTPIVERVAARYVDGDLSVGRVELTVWSTFPRARIDIDSLTVRSNSLARGGDSLRATLPADADTVLFAAHFHAGIVLSELAKNHIDLFDLELRNPRINLLIVNDSINNYDCLILPQDSTANDEPDAPMPVISVDRFRLVGESRIAFRSLGDSIDVCVETDSVSVLADQPAYRLATAFAVRADIADIVQLERLALCTDGRVTWDMNRPAHVALDGFTIALDGMPMRLSAEADFSAEKPRVERLDFSLPETKIADIVAAVPAKFRGQIPAFESDLRLALEARLTEPFDMMTDSVPSVDLDINIPKGFLKMYEGKLALKTVRLKTKIHLDGRNLDRSTADIDALTLESQAISLGVTGKASHPLSDPLIDAHVKGTIHFDRLAEKVKSLIPGTLSGRLTTDADFRFRLSSLSAKSFHKMNLSGNLELQDVYYTNKTDSLSVDIYARQTVFKLGTNSAFTRKNGEQVDSLLTASVRCDTIRLMLDNDLITAGSFRVGLGCLNKAASRDTSQINPIGGSFSIGNLTCLAADSSRVRLREVSVGGFLHRYGDSKKLPEFMGKASAKSVRYRDRLNSFSLRESVFDIVASLKPKRERTNATPRRRTAAADSALTAGREKVQVEIDSSMRRLIRRLNLRGHVEAKSGRIATPYFPLKTRVRDLNLHFTADSVTLTHALCTVGRSDFSLEGSVSNISRFLTSRRGAPLGIDFAASSDTIDVNELSYAMFAGIAFSEKQDSVLASLAGIDNEDQLEEKLAQTATDSVQAVVVPYNIAASFTVNAKNVEYTDIHLSDFSGILKMQDGAVNLQNLSARTSVGDAQLTALYAAPTIDDISFGFGMQLRDVDLKEAVNLVPGIDTIMPMLRSFAGHINADIAATTDIDRNFNFVIPSLNAAIKLEGDSLVLMDEKTFKTVSKWLMFKDKKRNVIDRMRVELLVRNSVLELFPFVFNIDRYRLGVMGYNDMALNLNYHVSVLKSPLPFKFGINLTGNADDMKIRIGKARYNEKSAGQAVSIVDTTRINLLQQIETIFQRGARTQELRNLQLTNAAPAQESFSLKADTLSHADSAELIRQGYLENPEAETARRKKMPKR